MTTTIVSRPVVEELANWQVLTLRQAGITLIDCEHRTPPAANDGFPYVAIPQIKNGRLDLSDARKITKEHFGEWTKKARPQGFDVILSRRCNPGETAFVPHGLDCALGQNLVLLRADGSRVYPPFLRWVVRGSEWWEQIGKFINVGAIFDSLKCADVPNFHLSIPPLPEQRRIADILGTLDDKIELNRRMNETLEVMARTLFQSWFIDFDPVHAKAAIRREHPNWTNAQVSRAALPNLVPETAELFPDCLVEAATGLIPKGWQCVGVPEAIDINPTRSLSKGAIAPYLEMSNMPTRSARATEWVDREFNSGTKFINGDTLVARITPCLENGKTAYVDFLQNGQVAWGSTEYIVLRPKSPLPTTFAYFLARNEDFRQHLITNMTGTSGRQRAPADCLNSYLIVVPSEPIARLFGETVEPYFTLLKANDEKTAALATTRDTLLPKLLSGDTAITLLSEDYS